MLLDAFFISLKYFVLSAFSDKRVFTFAKEVSAATASLIAAFMVLTSFFTLADAAATCPILVIMLEAIPDTEFSTSSAAFLPL